MSAFLLEGVIPKPRVLFNGARDDAVVFSAIFADKILRSR
jgi:hypothetical protein